MIRAKVLYDCSNYRVGYKLLNLKKDTKQKQFTNSSLFDRRCASRLKMREHVERAGVT